MLDLFQTMADACGGILPVVQLIRKGVFPIIQIGIPILLILMGTIDLGKAVLSNDDKEIKGSTTKLIKRAIAALAVFFISTLVTVIMGWIGLTDVGEQGGWATCWEEAGK